MLVGLTAADAVDQSLRRQQLQRHTVSAVLTEKGPSRTSARAMDDSHVWTTVRWTTIDGSTRPGQTEVTPGISKGTQVRVWLDARGNLASKPLSAAQERFQAAWAGSLAALGAGTAVFGGGRLACWRLEQHRMQEWAKEWEHVGERWGRKTG